MTDHRYIIFDTETTGVDDTRQAVDVGMMEVDGDLNIIGEATSLIKPTCPISETAQAIHGISMEMLADAPTIEEWVEQTFGGRLEGKVALIGHKISFDRPMFGPIGDVDRMMDTLIHAQVTWPDSENHKLDTLKEYLGLEGGGTSHRAMPDVITCYQLLQKLVEKTGRNFADLVSVEKMFLHRCPWGKHQGKPIRAVPKKYRDWMLSVDIDPNLRYTLEQVALLDIELPKPRGPAGSSRIVIPKRGST